MTEEDQQVGPLTEEDANKQYFASDYDTDGSGLYENYDYQSDEDCDILTRDSYHQATQTLGYTRRRNRTDNRSPRRLQVFEQTSTNSLYVDIATQVDTMSEQGESSIEGNAQIILPTAEQALAAANERIAEMEATIAAMKVAGQELEKVVTTARTPKVSTPDTFDGSRDKLSNYLTQIGTYMLFNIKLFPAEREKVLYAASYLRGAAAAWFQPYALEIMAEGTVSAQAAYLFGAFENYVKAINQTFGTINEVQDAERNILQLKQLGAASTYTTKFMQYRAHLAWDDTALVAQYYNGLKDHLKIELAKIERPTELTKLIDIVVNLDDRIYDAKKHAQGGAMRGPKMPFRTDQRNDKGRNEYRAQTRWPSNNQARFTGARNGTYGGNYGPAPMELGVVMPKKPNQQRRDVKDVECYNCHEKGHFSRDCSKPRNDRQQGRPDGRTNRPETQSRALHIIQKKLESPLDTSNSERDETRQNNNFDWQNIDQSSSKEEQPEPQDHQGMKAPLVQGNAIDSSDSDGAHEWENPRYSKLTKALPTQEEEEWLTAHPLRNGSEHHHYRRDNRGKLWQQFETKSPYKTYHSVRTRRIPTQTKCTEDWCKNNGLRSKLGVSRWTFSNKCERTCSGFTCRQCHKKPQVASSNSVYAGTCGECRDNEEREKIARRMADEGIISENTDLQDRIEHHAFQRGGVAAGRHIQRLWRRKYGEHCTRLPVDWNTHTGDIVYKGTVARPEKPCDACYDEAAALATKDRRTHVCHDCAKLWLKATGETHWLMIVPKN